MLTNVEESPNLQHHRCKAMFLASEVDSARLCQALNEESVDYRGWSDNGGDPDGSSWLIWPCDDALIAHAERAGVTYEVVAGFELPYPHALSEAYARHRMNLPGQWSGISSEECAFVVGESDAAQFIRAVSAAA